jgi:TetR/AcrR family transcriptional regulator, cholesterol catabolism regulator
MDKELSFQELRYQQKRQDILVSAGRLFAKKGYEKATLDEIAAGLKLKKRALYYYIKSKDEMLFQIQMQSLKAGNDLIQQVLKTDMTASEKLIEVIKGTVEISTRDYIIGSIHQKEFIFPEKMRKQIFRDRRRYYDGFLKIIQQGVKEGVFKAKGWKIRAFGALGAMNWVTRWYSPQGKLTAEEIGSEMADFILKGFAEKRE